MKGNLIIRESNGRIVGTIDEFWISEDEYWQDRKVKNVRFPEHKDNLNGEVITYHISDLK